MSHPPPGSVSAHLYLSARQPASPAPPAPSQFPSNLAWALARHSGCPLPAARRTSLARKGRPWPRSGPGGCWQRLCSRQEAEEAGLRWGCGQTGLRGHRHKGPPRPCTPHCSGSRASVAVAAPERAPLEGVCRVQHPPSPSLLLEIWATLGLRRPKFWPTCPPCHSHPPTPGPPWLRCRLPLPHLRWPWALGRGDGWGWWGSRMEPAH